MRKLLNTLYVTTPEAYLTKDGLNVVVSVDKEERFRIPILNVESIVTFGYMGASPGLMKLCMDNNVSLSFMTPQGRFISRVQGATRGNVLLRKKQYTLSEDENVALHLAKLFITGKVFNTRSILQRYIRDNGADEEVESVIKQLDWRKKRIMLAENMEILRDNCKTIRDLAIIDLLSSTGMRVGELVKLNRTDVNFNERECIVFGKGNKERVVYFNARAKIHLQQYLKSRKDKNPALFVPLDKPHERLQISGVEVRLRQLGRSLKVPRIHPHKFRRTLATMAIDKGMPVEQVQKLLGHVKIDTTMRYAMVNQTNVKLSHRKYIA